MIKAKSIQALIFVLSTFIISWTEQYFIIRGDGIQNPIRSFCLMWTPGLVGILCALFFDKNIKAIAFKVPSLRSLGLAYFVPAVTAVLMVALLCVFSLSDFQVSPQLIEKKGSLQSALFAALNLAPTVGMILAFFSGLGEEVGWRGFLHSKLLDITPAKRYFIIGVIWSLWHWPLIIFGDYSTSDHPWLNVVFFSVAAISLSFFMGWLRDSSKSVIPAALVHASHNMWILGIAPAFFRAGPLVPYYGEESGLFCALIYLLLGTSIFLRLRKAHHVAGMATSSLMPG